MAEQKLPKLETLADFCGPALKIARLTSERAAFDLKTNVRRLFACDRDGGYAGDPKGLHCEAAPARAARRGGIAQPGPSNSRMHSDG